MPLYHMGRFLLQMLESVARETTDLLINDNRLEDEWAKEVGILTQRCLFLVNPLQWTSTYPVLELALKFKDIFILLQENDSAYELKISGAKTEKSFLNYAYDEWILLAHQRLEEMKSSVINPNGVIPCHTYIDKR